LIALAACSSSDEPAPSSKRSCPTESGTGCAPQSQRVDLYSPTFSKPTQVTNQYYPVSNLHSVVFTGTVDSKPFRTETTILPKTHPFEWNGQTLDTVVQQYMAFSDGRLEEVAIDFTDVGAARTIVITVPEPTSPKELGTGSDDRKLALALGRLRIVGR